MRNNLNDGTEIFTILGVIGTIILLLFIAPWLTFWLAYVGGLICRFMIGDPLTVGLNIIFNGRFTKDLIPLLSGTLGWIGTFFKNAVNIKNKYSS